MKYLRKYNELLDTINPTISDDKQKEISDTITDILSDISDDGYYINNKFFYKPGVRYGGNYITIRKEDITSNITQDSCSFNVMDIFGDINRVNEYLKMVGFHIIEVAMTTGGHGSTKQSNIRYDVFSSRRIINVTSISLLIGKI